MYVSVTASLPCVWSAEMAERHDVQHILKIARELVHKVQSLMDNKWPQRSKRRQRGVPSSRTLSSSSDSLTVFQASTHPEHIHWVPPCPNEGPGLWVGALPRQLGSGVLPQSVYIHRHPECPWCLFRHVDLSACFVSLTTLWAHSWVPHAPYWCFYVCAWKHTQTHTLIPFFLDRCPFFSDSEPVGCLSGSRRWWMCSPVWCEWRTLTRGRI